MIAGNHIVVTESKKYPEFKKDEVVMVKRIDRKGGIYEVNGKQYRAKILKSMLSPIKE